MIGIIYKICINIFTWDTTTINKQIAKAWTATDHMEIRPLR